MKAKTNGCYDKINHNDTYSITDTPHKCKEENNKWDC